VLSFLCILSAHIKSSEQNYFALLYFVCREITRRKVALYRGDGDMPNVIWHMWLSLLNGFPHRLTMPRPTLPPAPVYSAAVDSPVINFMADYFRPRTHQVLFLLCIFLVYFNYYEHNYSALWYFLYVGELFIIKWHYTVGDGGVPTSFGTGGRYYSTDSHTSFQLCGRLPRPHRFTTPRTTRPSAFAAGSRIHTGLQ